MQPTETCKPKVDAGRFRQDSYYRLAVIPIELAPLRNRGETIEVSDLPPQLRSPQRDRVDLTMLSEISRDEAIDNADYAYLTTVLRKHDGVIASAARQAGLSRQGMNKLLKRHRIQADVYGTASHGTYPRLVAVDGREVPFDVITMNSTVRLRDMQTMETETFTLVYPEEASITAGKLSILALLGTAILGYRVGDLVRWQVPSGVGRWQVEELLFQPEREVASIVCNASSHPVS